MKYVYPDNGSSVNTAALSSCRAIRTHRVPDAPSPLPEDNLRRFTRAFYCRVILPLAAKTGMAWGRVETWLRKTAEKFKQITKRTFDAYLAELLACGWIEYQIDDRGNLSINPLYCPPAAEDRRAAGYAPPAEWSRKSSAAKVFSARISAESSTETPGFCSSSSYSIREDLEKENELTKPETVPVPNHVVSSLALQGEAEEKPSPSRKSESESVSTPLDLPAAALQLLTEGKITEGFAAAVLAKEDPATVTHAIAAAQEQEAKGLLRTMEGYLRRAVAGRWKANGKAGKAAPTAPTNQPHSGIVRSPRPVSQDRSTMYAAFVPEDQEREAPVKAAGREAFRQAWQEKRRTCLTGSRVGSR